MRRRQKWIILLAILLLTVIATVAYVENYYRADSVAIAALASDDTVQVTQTDYGWLFDGPFEDCALIFYPGARVEETAYAPLLHMLAQEGMDVCLVRMPLRLAFMGVNRADAVMEEYSYSRWYVGGHSLGGSIAAYYASTHSERLEGVALLASYPIKRLDDRLNTVFIYGSEDGVLNMARYSKYKKLAPDDAGEFVIQGGNHAWFGSYGSQAGDGEAFITPAEQQRETVRDILETLNREEGRKQPG